MGFTIDRLVPNGPGGPTMFVPTRDDRKRVALLAAAGTPMVRIAAAIGPDGITETELLKHFRRELSCSRDLFTVDAMAGLHRGVKKGHPWAVCFWLKCKAGFIENTGKLSIEVSGQQKPVELMDMDKLIADADAVEAAERNTITVQSSDPDE